MLYIYLVVLNWKVWVAGGLVDHTTWDLRMERKGAYYALVAAQESSEKAEEDKTKESEYLDLDLFSGVFFTASTMVFITIFHHHLGEDFF